MQGYIRRSELLPSIPENSVPNHGNFRISEDESEEWISYKTPVTAENGYRPSLIENSFKDQIQQRITKTSEVELDDSSDFSAFTLIHWIVITLLLMLSVGFLSTSLLLLSSHL